MAGYFGSIKPYFLIGLLVYVIYRGLLRLLYRGGRMRVPVAHEVGMALLAWWLLTLFSASVSPALGFSLKPAFPGTNLIPVYGTVRMVRVPSCAQSRTSSVTLWPSSASMGEKAGPPCAVVMPQEA